MQLETNASRLSRYARTALLAFTAGAAHAGEPPRVVVTIAPLHSLVAAVMEGVGSPSLLISGGQSPHVFALRPSQVRLLARADRVFWIGPGLEAAVARALDSQGAGTRAVALGRPAGGRAAALRDAAPETHGDNEHHEHEHSAVEAHPWLDPVLARAMVGTVARVLAGADAANSETYANNARTLERRLAALDAELRITLAPIAARRYVVFHDAYGALERRYGLARAVAVRLNPHAPPGAGHVLRIRRELESGSAGCVFAEPQFEPKLVRALVKGTGARTGVLDPLGTSLEPGPSLYFELMRTLAGALVECVQGSGDSRTTGASG